MWGRDKPEPQAQPTTPPTANRAQRTQPIETTIGPNTHIKGEIQGDGGLRIEGIVEGDVETTGNLMVTESAKVLAEIKANNVSIAGAVRGNISANRVEILDSGRVWGDLTIKSLLINEGAYLSGKTIMPQDLQPPQIEASKPEERPRPSGTPAGLKKEPDEKKEPEKK
jgi:cytoskeletal protein CcmA (bactofilin family)